MGVMLASFVWGFSEATLFFLIPDVIISYVALTHFKKAVLASFLAVFGALLGGTVMYTLAAGNHAQMVTVLDRVPAISEDMIERVETDLQENGWSEVFLGPTKGLPYKIYATHAPEVGMSYWLFLLISIPARLFRFFLAACTSYLLAQVLFRKQPHVSKVAGWLCIWIGIYGFYFTKFGF